MKRVIQNLEGVVEQIGDLADTKVAIWKLKAADTVNNYLASIIGIFLFIFLSLVAALFLGFGLAYFLGQVLHNTGLGFLITGGIFAIIGLFFFMLRRKIFPRILHNSFMQLVFKKDAHKYKNPEAALNEMLMVEQTQKNNIKHHVSETAKDISYMFALTRLVRMAGKMVVPFFNGKDRDSENETNRRHSRGLGIKRIIGSSIWSAAVELLLSKVFSGAKAK